MKYLCVYCFLQMYNKHPSGDLVAEIEIACECTSLFLQHNLLCVCSWDKCTVCDGLCVTLGSRSCYWLLLVLQQEVTLNLGQLGSEVRVEGEMKGHEEESVLKTICLQTTKMCGNWLEAEFGA